MYFILYKVYSSRILHFSKIKYINTNYTNTCVYIVYNIGRYCLTCKQLKTIKLKYKLLQKLHFYFCDLFL